MQIKPFESRENIWKYMVNKEAEIEWSKSIPIPIPKVEQVKVKKNMMFWKIFIISNLKQLNP